MSLVAAETSIQPGRSLTVAVRLEHQPSWHTYWLRAGTGFPTTLEWELPPGWTAAPIQWPTPTLIRGADGTITGNGYSGVLYLPVTLNPPATAKPEGQVKLKVLVKWLMCSDVCIPEHGEAGISLPLSANAPAPNTAVAEQIEQMPLPRLHSDWTISARRNATQAILEVSDAGAIQSPHFFSADGYIQFDDPQDVSSDFRRLRLTLPIAADVEGSPEKLVGVLAYADDRGVYRGLEVNIPLDANVSAAATGSSASSGGEIAAGAGSTGLSVTLLLALMGGLFLNLMPCVFPVLGIKVLGVVNQAGSDLRKVRAHGAAFSTGVLLSFWALAATLAALRAGGHHLGWGFQLQSPEFVFTLAVVVLVFALSLSGVFEFGLGVTGIGSRLQMKDGYVGSFFTGVLATVVATPCSAPFLAPALGAALTLPTGQSLLVFTAIAIGLALPYLFLCTFPGFVRVLPKPGRWMETLKQAMAFPLYATAAFLIWVLAGQVGDNGLLMALLGLTVAAMGVWVYGRYAAPGASAGRMRFGLIGAAVLLSFGTYLGWPQAAAATDITWEPWSAQRIEELRAQGRPVYVDFTARWCATCQANKQVVFSSQEVRRYFHERDVATLKADWTNSDPRITAELARWNRSAVPFDLIYRPTQSQPKVLPEILTPSIVLAALKH